MYGSLFFFIPCDLPLEHHELITVSTVVALSMNVFDPVHWKALQPSPNSQP